MRTDLILLCSIAAAVCLGGCRQTDPPDVTPVTEPAQPIISDTLTLSGEQLIALDWSGRSPSGGKVLDKHAVEATGAVFDIRFLGNKPWQNSITYVSSGSGGQMALVGLDVSAYRTFALKFTLVAIDGAVGPTLPQELTVGAVVGPTGDGRLSTYEPLTLSFSGEPTGVARTPITVSRLREIGFHLEMANPEVWDPNGAVVTLLVETVGEAISPATPVVEEPARPRPQQRPTRLPNFGPARTGAW